MRAKPKIIAFLGKGGSGKTVLSALFAKLLMREPDRKLLLIDADPAMGLTLALGIKNPASIAEARKELIKTARFARTENDKEKLAMMVDYLVLKALLERKDFSFMAMGRSQEKGCYCSVNSLLRESIEALSENFEFIIIDAEAGIEQVSREVTKRVSHPIIVTDSSLRGIATASAIAQALKSSSQALPTGIIFNRAARPEPGLLKRLQSSGLKTLGAIPSDQRILDFDRKGKPLLELPLNSPALIALRQILSEAKIFFSTGTPH